jgi:hypothetical protein
MAVARMLVYSFLIHNSDGSEREVAGRMALRDDVEAIAFGRSLIQDLTMHGDATEYTGCSVDIAAGKRAVYNIVFPAAYLSRLMH